jgi:hypothetical protein
MPIPTSQEIESGFEQRNPDPAQAQRIADVRAQLVAAAQFIAANCNDNRFAVLAIKSIQTAFSQARSSIVIPADAPTP